MIEVKRGTIALFGDIGCPWAHLAVYRLHSTRARLGLEDRLSFDIHSFPLELFNERPTPKITLEAETAVAGGLDPEGGWQLWTEPPFTYPVTTLLPMEAVHAAKSQDLGVSDRLDRALRLAFFGNSRCISMLHVILDVARGIAGLDADKLETDLKNGTARHLIFEDLAVAQENDVQGSPHVFLPGGENFHNPGIEMHWEGKKGGFPVIEKDAKEIYDEIFELAL